MVKKSYDSVDLVKFIASIFVVGLHADALNDVSTLLNRLIFGGVARLAVPFFFVASAYFFFRKEVTWENTKRYCKRLLILYIAWFIVSIPMTIFDRFYASEYSLLKTSILFLRSFFVTSTFSGSWFIVSCIFCALLFFAIEKLDNKKRKIVTAVLSVVFYLWCVFTSAYGALKNTIGLNKFYHVYTLLFANPYCSFLVGIPYFALGRYFAKVDFSEFKEKSNKLTTPFFVCLFLLLFEVYCTYKYKLTAATDCYLMLLPCTYFFFPIILNWKISLKNATTLRVASTIIFFSQFLILYVWEFAEWFLKITIPCLAKFTLTVLCALLLTFVIMKLKDKKNFKWLKYFY